ncbi:hypothetical protein BCR34DRAFT_607053 [Clohesyomyces aquaticus]|uniref:F-box domain-containing protein n=1 Tax=Clohesyomyces aquaticus TaxID=1231657 RepID=A0A1Y1YKF2_9PLEO|nr:hypothetical protein BCR34DRAFT_607053 [Clohesyomyces aquaticus]
MPQPRSSHNDQNRAWVEQEGRSSFLTHLRAWSCNSQSSLHFAGKLCLSTQQNLGAILKLGEPVKCRLTGTTRSGEWISAIVTVKLFAPRHEGGQYRLLVRYGAGWIPAREYFDKIYFSRRNRRDLPYDPRVAHDISRRSSAPPSPKTQEKDEVGIGPLFPQFFNLPTEIQHTILGFVLDKREYFKPASHTSFGNFVSTDTRLGTIFGYTTERRKRRCTGKHAAAPAPNTPISTVFLISKSLNQHLVPWIYRTTNFYFEDRGLTHFLWTSGPVNRGNIKKLTLEFGSTAVLHCLRWYAPDPIFELFDITLGDPKQYLWRCQIQDLVRELHLSVLDIDIDYIKPEFIPFVARVLRRAFASVQTLRFTVMGVVLRVDDKRLDQVNPEKTWAELCRVISNRYYKGNTYGDFGDRYLGWTPEEFDGQMAGNPFFAEK